MSRPTGRFSRWLNRVIDADERYICGSCDDRFPGRAEGVAHVVAFHPEFVGTFGSEEPARDWTPASEPAPDRVLGRKRPLRPALG